MYSVHCTECSDGGKSRSVKRMLISLFRYPNPIEYYITYYKWTEWNHVHICAALPLHIYSILSSAYPFFCAFETKMTETFYFCCLRFYPLGYYYVVDGESAQMKCQKCSSLCMCECTVYVCMYVQTMHCARKSDRHAQ